LSREKFEKSFEEKRKAEVLYKQALMYHIVTEINRGKSIKDIAEYLRMRIETIYRIITQMKQYGLIENTIGEAKKERRKKRIKEMMEFIEENDPKEVIYTVTDLAKRFGFNPADTRTILNKNLPEKKVREIVDNNPNRRMEYVVVRLPPGKEKRACRIDPVQV
jgi:transposase